MGNNMMNVNTGFNQQAMLNNPMGNAINRPPPNQSVLDAANLNPNQLPNIPVNDPSMVSL